jgi:hypothetical protein
MQFLLKCLDDVDDLFATVGHHGGPVLKTVVLVVGFCAAVGALLLFAPHDLLASP